MRFEYDGREYDVDLDRISLAETIMLKKTSGMTVGNIVQGANDWDGEAYVAILFLGMRRNKEAVRWQDLMDVNVVELMASAADKLREEREAEDGKSEVAAAEDNTKDLKGGKTPKSSSSRTSSS